MSYYTVLYMMCTMSVACCVLLACCFWRLKKMSSYLCAPQHIAIEEGIHFKECWGCVSRVISTQRSCILIFILYQAAVYPSGSSTVANSGLYFILYVVTNDPCCRLDSDMEHISWCVSSYYQPHLFASNSERVVLYILMKVPLFLLWSRVCTAQTTRSESRLALN